MAVIDTPCDVLADHAARVPAEPGNVSDLALFRRERQFEPVSEAGWLWAVWSDVDWLDAVWL